MPKQFDQLLQSFAPEVKPVRTPRQYQRVFQDFRDGICGSCSTDNHLRVDCRNSMDPKQDSVLYVNLVWGHYSTKLGDLMVIARWHKGKLYIRRALELGTWSSPLRDLVREFAGHPYLDRTDPLTVFVTDDELLQERGKAQLDLLHAISPQEGL